MSIILRTLLVIAAVVSYVYVIHKIRKAQMKIEGALYWVFLASLILLLSIFPVSIIWLADLIGVDSPVNLLYLLMIFLVLWKLFSLTVKNSQLENKINVLTEELAIRQLQQEKQNKIEESNNEK